jgi:murein DD-endopeptidase / murein LD-carboxypeptidase
VAIAFGAVGQVHGRALFPALRLYSTPPLSRGCGVPLRSGSPSAAMHKAAKLGILSSVFSFYFAAMLGRIILLATTLAMVFSSCSHSRKTGGIPPTSQSPAPFPTDSVLSSRLGQPVPKGANPQLVASAADWLGTPYRYGGSDTRGIDCSGLINSIFPKVYGTTVPRSTAQLFAVASPISINDIREGDLLFFTIDTQKPGHAGIYLWHNRFLHASTSKGVIISSLNEPYWQKYFTGAGRIIQVKP